MWGSGLIKKGLQSIKPIQATWHASRTIQKVGCDPTPIGKANVITLSIADSILRFKLGGVYTGIQSFHWLASNARAAQKARRTLSYLQEGVAPGRRDVSLEGYQAALKAHGDTLNVEHPTIVPGLIFAEICLRMHESGINKTVDKFLDGEGHFWLERCLKHFYSTRRRREFGKLIAAKRQHLDLSVLAYDDEVVEAALNVLHEINKKHMLYYVDFLFLAS